MLFLPLNLTRPLCSGGRDRWVFPPPVGAPRPPASEPSPRDSPPGLDIGSRAPALRSTHHRAGGANLATAPTNHAPTTTPRSSPQAVVNVARPPNQFGGATRPNFPQLNIIRGVIRITMDTIVLMTSRGRCQTVHRHDMTGKISARGWGRSNGDHRRRALREDGPRRPKRSCPRVSMAKESPTAAVSAWPPPGGRCPSPACKRL